MGEVTMSCGERDVFPEKGILAVLLINDHPVAAADFMNFVGVREEVKPFFKRTLPQIVRIEFLPGREALEKYPKLNGTGVLPLSEIGDDRGWHIFASRIKKQTGFSYDLFDREFTRMLYNK